jgi:serine/threonine protein phosphatase PrpC
MGNTQHTHFVRSLNGLNGKSQPRRIRIKHISNDDDETDGDGDFPFATFDKNPTPVRIRFPYGYSSDYQSFCVAITNQPQLFWRSSNSNENNVVSQPRVLFLSQVKSMTRQEATLLVLKTSLHFDVEILTSSSLEAKKWIAAMVSQKHHPHGAIVFMSCNEDLSEKAKELLMGYSRPYIMGHNNIGSRRKRDVNQPPPEAEFGVSFGYAECRNAGKSSANEDTAVYHCGMFPLCRTPYTLFAIFDGHGGWGVSCFAQRHFVRIFESVTKRHLDTLARYNLSSNSTFSSSSSSSSFSSSSWETTKSQLGAILNESVVQLDNAIEGEKKIELSGSTVLVLLRAKGRIWIACSGDSAAVACTTATTNTTKDDEDVRGAMLHTQHTVENERQRLQWIAAMKPDLLRGCFSRRIFEPPKGIIKFHGSWRPSRDDIGSRVLHWDYHLTSAPMPTTIFKEDVVVVTEGSSRHRNETGSFRTKAPMLSGSGNYMRLLGLLGCARGVGDFGTVASCRSVPVKPFLSSRPDVKMFDFDGDSETYCNSPTL